jgi:flagellar biosynthesis protein FlhF
MTTQIFRGRTEQQARQSAVEAFGPDAVVVSAREVPRKGLPGLLGLTEFEVAAARAGRVEALPFAAGAYETTTRPTQRGDDVIRLRAELRSELRHLKTQVTKTRAAGPGDDVGSEIAALRRSIEELTSLAPAPSNRDRCWSLVQSTGIEGTTARHLVRALRAAAQEAGDDDDAWQGRLADALAGVVMAAPFPIAPKRRSVLSLVGPSGVGKTTTAAKLAARAMFDYQASVTLVSCDTYRVGAIEQLARYAELLGAKLESASNGEELAKILRAAATDVVIVDTSGQIADFGEGVADVIAATVPGRDRDTLLCMTASTRAVDAAEIGRTFAALSPTAVIVTKLDETQRPAGLVHATAATKGPVCALCFGPRVPEDIGPATAGAMVDRLLRPLKQRQVAANRTRSR